MPRSYVRIPVFTNRERKDYPGAALGAWLVLTCLAEQQPIRGRFESLKALRVLLGKHARWLAFLIDERDLIPAVDVDPSADPDEWYYAAWDELMEGRYDSVADRVRALGDAIFDQKRPLTGAERQARYLQGKREREQAERESRHSDVTPVTPNGGGMTPNGGGGDDGASSPIPPLPTRRPNPSMTYVELTARRLGDVVDRWLHDYCREFTPARVDQTLRDLWAERQDPDGLMERLRERLRQGPRPVPRLLERPAPDPPPTDEQRAAAVADARALLDDPSTTPAARKAAERAVRLYEARTG